MGSSLQPILFCYVCDNGFSKLSKYCHGLRQIEILAAGIMSILYAKYLITTSTQRRFPLRLFRRFLKIP